MCHPPLYCNSRTGSQVASKAKQYRSADILFRPATGKERGDKKVRAPAVAALPRCEIRAFCGVLASLPLGVFALSAVDDPDFPLAFWRCLGHFARSAAAGVWAAAASC